MKRRWIPSYTPEPDGLTCGQRAEHATRALKSGRYDAAGSDPLTATGDLLGDLMHYADREGFDFEEAMARARKYYEEETP